MEGFDFDNNAEFQTYLKRIDLEVTSLDAVKRKWYQKTFGGAGSGSSSSSSARSSASSSSSSSSSSASPSSSRPAASTPFRFGAVDILVWLQTASIVLTLLNFFGGIFGLFASGLKLALLLQLCVWLLILYREVGRSFSFSAEFAARAFQQDAAHYAVYSLLFFSVGENVITMVPLAIYSFFNSLVTWTRFFPALSQFNEYRPRALALAVRVEVFLLPFLVISALFLGGSWIAILGHYNFLKFRYMFSMHTRATVDGIVAWMDYRVRAIPMVAPWYFKIRNWLAR